MHSIDLECTYMYIIFRTCCLLLSRGRPVCVHWHASGQAVCALCEWITSGQAVCGELKKETHFIICVKCFCLYSHKYNIIVCELYHAWWHNPSDWTSSREQFAGRGWSSLGARPNSSGAKSRELHVGSLSLFPLPPLRKGLAPRLGVKLVWSKITIILIYGWHDYYYIYMKH